MPEHHDLGKVSRSSKYTKYSSVLRNLLQTRLQSIYSTAASWKCY